MLAGLRVLYGVLTAQRLDLFAGYLLMTCRHSADPSRLRPSAMWGIGLLPLATVVIGRRNESAVPTTAAVAKDADRAA